MRYKSLKVIGGVKIALFSEKITFEYVFLLCYELNDILNYEDNYGVIDRS